MLFGFCSNDDGVEVVEESAGFETEKGSANQDAEIIHERYIGIFFLQYL